MDISTYTGSQLTYIVIGDCALAGAATIGYHIPDHVTTHHLLEP